MMASFLAFLLINTIVRKLHILVWKQSNFDIMLVLHDLYMLPLFVQNIGNNINRRLDCKVI